MEIRRPRVVIVAGIDGAGKSTAARALLTEFGIDTCLDAEAFVRTTTDMTTRRARQFRRGATSPSSAGAAEAPGHRLIPHREGV